MFKLFFGLLLSLLLVSAFTSFSQNTEPSIRSISDCSEKISHYSGDSITPFKAQLQRLNVKSSILTYVDAHVLFNEHKYDKAIPLYLKIFDEDKSLSSNDSLIMFIELKQCYFKIRIFPKVLEIHKKIVQLAKQMGITNPWMFSPPLSQVFHERGLNSAAISQLKQEFNQTDRLFKDDYFIAAYYNNLGFYWYKAKNADSALANFSKSKKYIAELLKKDPTSHNNIFFEGLVDGNIGQVHMMTGKYAEAIPLLKKDIVSSIMSKNYVNAAVSYNELAECCIETKKYDDAQIYLDSAKILLTGKEDVDPILKNILTNGKLYSKKNEFEKAYYTLNKYWALNDSINKIQDEKQLISSQIAYEVESKETQLVQQKILIEKAEDRANYQKELSMVLIVCFIGILIISIVIYYYYKQSKKQQIDLAQKNKEIEKQKSTIEASLTEKVLLIKEIHHRVKNNLQVVSSLLNIQADKADNPALTAVLLDNKKRISAIALVHELLYKNQNMANINMKEYISMLATHLMSFSEISETPVESDLDIEDIALDLDTAIPIGLIINELISNSFKHAFKSLKSGLITVRFNRNRHNTYTLFVSDNGCGLPAGYQNNLANTLGIELVHILAEQVNATVTIENNSGTAFTFTFAKR
jgi:two-component sensor histidine kinase